MKARPILVPAKLLNVLYIPFLNSVIKIIIPIFLK
jgi:hypothetical protein